MKEFTTEELKTMDPVEVMNLIHKVLNEDSGSFLEFMEKIGISRAYVFGAMVSLYIETINLGFVHDQRGKDDGQYLKKQSE